MLRTRVTTLCYLEATGVERQQKSHMGMKIPSTIALSCSTLSPLLTVGKNKVGYFLDRPRRTGGCLERYSKFDKINTCKDRASNLHLNIAALEGRVTFEEVSS
jgi:hypothetical protein